LCQRAIQPTQASAIAAQAVRPPRARKLQPEITATRPAAEPARACL
jgi:hypothetical protein